MSFPPTGPIVMTSNAYIMILASIIQAAGDARAAIRPPIIRGQESEMEIKTQEGTARTCACVEYEGCCHGNAFFGGISAPMLTAPREETREEVVVT